MVPEGGLFVPESIPQMSEDEFTALIGKSYQKIAEVSFRQIFDGLHERRHYRVCEWCL